MVSDNALLPEPAVAESLPAPEAAQPRRAAQRVAKNTTVLVVGQFVVQACMALIGILVARTFGETLYGQYTLAFAFIGIFSLLFSLGADAIIVREVARQPEATWQTFSAGLWLRLVSFPLTIGIVVVGARLAGYDGQQQHLILLATLAMGFSAVADLARVIFQGQQRMEWDTITRAVEKLTALGLVVLVITRAAPALEGILWAIILGALAGAGSSWIVLPWLAGRPVLAPPRHSLRLLRLAAPVGGSMLITSLYLQLPAVILSQFVPIGDVGLFSAANGVVTPFMLLPVAVGTALLPALASAARNVTRSTVRTHYLTAGVVLALGVPITLILIFFGGDVLRILYGPSFQAAAEALAILSMVIPLVFVNTYMTNYIIAKGQQNLLLLATLNSLILTVVFCLGFIPSVGYRGAAIARVLAECGNLALMLYLTTRWLRRQMAPAHSS
jgi:O-antigen/teichoic acid export membrane protein